MCTNSNIQANVSLNLETIKTVIAGQLDMIGYVKAQPEAIYLEKKCHDLLTGDLISQLVRNSGLAGITEEDITVQRYKGIPIVRMEDVRNMNHHQYFKGWGLPVQVTVKPNSYPKSPEQLATEQREDFLNSGGKIEMLPEYLRELALNNVDGDFAESRVDDYEHNMTNPINLRLKHAFDWDNSREGLEFWAEVSNGNFPEGTTGIENATSENKKEDMKHVGEASEIIVDEAEVRNADDEI